MFISVLDLFSLGVGPSSSHTVGPMRAAHDFRQQLGSLKNTPTLRVSCQLKQSLALTGIGHGTDKAIVLGLHGFQPEDLIHSDVDALYADLRQKNIITILGKNFHFDPKLDVIFDKDALDELHPNAMTFVYGQHQTDYYSVGGGFVMTRDQMIGHVDQLSTDALTDCDYPFESAKQMLMMAKDRQLTIAQMKRANELSRHSESELQQGLEGIWHAMRQCVERGLHSEGKLPGVLNLPRRAKSLLEQLDDNDPSALNDYLSVYAMAVNEENAAGHSVVTAPTNGAAGVIPAVIYFYWKTLNWRQSDIDEFLLTAAAIGGLIKHRSSISGAEVGCQGEVGSAAAMAAAGLCAVLGGTPEQVENAAEIALEHHLGMTCDPVHGLVQVPCIERNAFGAVKAVTAANLALRGSGEHLMSLDRCIEAMRQTGLEMSFKLKETSLGGLAVAIAEC